VLLERPKSQHLMAKQLKFCKSQLGLDPDALMDALHEIEIVPEHRVKASAELLQIVGNYIVSISVAKLTQEKLLTEMKAREELEMSVKTLELKALQSQVNPHFLFNTLNAVVKQAMLEGADCTQKVVYSLAKLLRYNLGKINQHVTLRDEVANIRDYLFIQRTRFGDHVDAVIDIPEAILNVKVPPMTLQPLVENAIVHGIEPKVEGGIIFIRGWAENDCVIIEIADNGLGMSRERLDKIREKSDPACGQGNAVGIGIDNVQKRIQLYYGPRYGLTLNSEMGRGTVVKIKIPARSE
jgi:sensor histidine kinase YesM